jgi:hypothetical protein
MIVVVHEETDSLVLTVHGMSCAYNTSTQSQQFVLAFHRQREDSLALPPETDLV